VHIGLYTSMAGPYISQHQGGDGAALSMNRAAGPDWGIEGDWSGLLCNEQVAKPHRSDKPALKTSFRAGKRKKQEGGGLGLGVVVWDRNNKKGHHHPQKEEPTRGTSTVVARGDWIQ
jgi:hypothetical protein